ncbi:MAG: class I SAM-dependent methyltransferase [Candidatus Zixiibacteriota bacterium]
MNKKAYKWCYDNIHSVYYNLLMKYCFLPFGGEEKCRRELIDSADFSPGNRILDMCCGTGGATFAIAKKAGEEAEIIGMDLSSGQLKRARERNRFENIRFIEGDVTRTDLEEGYFDKVFITHALHEMVREERSKTLSEARRILKGGGGVIALEVDNPDGFFRRLFVGFWMFYWLPFNFETPTRRDMLKRGLTNELVEAGFKNIRKSPKHHGAFQVVEGEKYRVSA